MSDHKLMSGFPSSPEQQVSLANWRLSPFSSWSFHHARELLPTANIYRGCGPVMDLPSSYANLRNLSFKSADGKNWTIDEMLEASDTDGFLVLKSGKVVTERYFNGLTPETPHIIFSVSKSVAGSLAGVLVEQGKLDPDTLVAKYIPEIESSAYGDATVRHVLDMTVSIDFVEDYLNKEGTFARYRDATGWNPTLDPARLSDLRSFLVSLPRGSHPHGEKFCYVSPNSDMLGWILERAAGQPYAKLLSELVWQKMGAEFDAYITVDRLGAPRSAGGLCCTLRDLARFGEIMRHNGKFGNTEVLPANWVHDIRNAGDYAAWQRGSIANFLPKGRYRSKWYQVDPANGSFCAIGIHGQWIYIDPKAEVVIVKLSSQKLPDDAKIDRLMVSSFALIADALR